MSYRATHPKYPSIAHSFELVPARLKRIAHYIFSLCPCMRNRRSYCRYHNRTPQRVRQEVSQATAPLQGSVGSIGLVAARLMQDSYQMSSPRSQTHRRPKSATSQATSHEKQRQIRPNLASAADVSIKALDNASSLSFAEMFCWALSSPHVIITTLFEALTSLSRMQGQTSNMRIQNQVHMILCTR